MLRRRTNQRSATTEPSTVATPSEPTLTSTPAGRRLELHGQQAGRRADARADHEHEEGHGGDDDVVVRQQARARGAAASHFGTRAEREPTRARVW